MYLPTYHLRIIGLLSSLSLVFAQSAATRTDDLELGYANIQTVVTSPAGPAELAGRVVVRISDSRNVQSFGATDEVGGLIMPLPVGRYCYEAFTAVGKALRLVRQPSERCFPISRGKTIDTIGLAVQPDLYVR
jgi:hypothetical protein